MPVPPKGALKSPRPSPVPAFFLYGEAPRAPDEATAHIETIAARSRLHDWTIQPHRHRDLHQILLVKEGAVTARLDRGTTALKSPCLVVAPPGVVHAFEFEVDTVGWICSFSVGLAQDMCGRSADFRAFLERPTAVALASSTLTATDLMPLCDMLLREFERSALGRESALRGLLGAWTANVYRTCQSRVRDSNEADTRKSEVVAKFRESIECHLQEHADIETHCRAVGVSESQLRRACLAVTGQAPVALVQLRMLVEAERQLRYTAMSIAQVAYYLGFDDPAYFSRFFRRQTGVSPKGFRARALDLTAQPTMAADRQPAAHPP
jgi:AraC family transcriptional regulator, transcriptional activator of pobA